jgi:predicted PurR-regulated permease PerM
MLMLAQRNGHARTSATALGNGACLPALRAASREGPRVNIADEILPADKPVGPHDASPPAAPPEPPGGPVPAPPPRRRRRAGEVATVIVAGLAIVYTVYFARSFLVPIALALLFALLLWPLVASLKRLLRIPEPAGALLVVAALVGGAILGIQIVVKPANQWMQDVPAAIDKLEHRLAALKRSFERVRETTEQVGQLASAASGKDEAQQPVVAATPSLGDRLFSSAVEGAIAIASAVVLLYFFLASGDLFLRKLVRVVPRLRDKIRAVEIASQIRTDIGKYLRTITFINVGVGIAVGLAMWALEIPHPIVWGVLAGLLNFIPYLGALVIEVAVFLVATSVYEGVSQALIPPVVVLGIQIVESQLITPFILGRALTLNPVVVLVALLLWGWLWGIPGVILAVPILIGLRIASDHIEALAPIGEFLSEK